MRHTTGTHEPTPEFRARLEREIVRSYRRDARRLLAFPAVGRRDWLRSAAVILIALVTGAAAGVLPAQVQDGRERNRLLEAERAAAQLATARARLERAELEELRRRVAVGMVGRESLAAAEAELFAMEKQLTRARLNMAEIEAAAKPPRDDLIAPLVDRRDFVRARLELELELAQKRLTAAETAAQEVERRYDVGIAQRAAVLESQAELARARSEMELLIAKLDLRREFLERSVSPAQVRQRLETLEVEQRLRDARSLYENAAERLVALRRMRAAGQVEQLEVLSAEVETLRLEREIELLGALRETLGRARP